MPADDIEVKMDIYGLLGFPLGHSFSASYFHEKFLREHICADYRNFACSDVHEAIGMLRKLEDLKGFNVTIPHKQSVMPFLASVSEEAQAIGAVNVVKVERDSVGAPIFVGYNSDLVGFRESIRPMLGSAHRSALVLGTGGASKAVVYGLHQLGIATLGVSRTEKEGCVTYEQLTEQLMRKHLVVVNCTPLGMYPKVNAAPDIPYEALTPDHVLFDLVYNPDVTQFMRRGMERGARVKNGLEMLHRQAEAAWDIWNGKVD